MPYSSLTPGLRLTRDATAGLVIFLVALPLCLGVALASNAPLFGGLIAGIVGGLVVGAISGSHTSVSGPAAGLTAVVAAQIAALGAYESFLLAVLIAGAIQIAMGLLRAGFLAAFFPSSVIQGLLAAIGVILILKQVPHLVGHDRDPEGEMSFVQPDQETTLSELGELLGDIHVGAAVIGLASMGVLLTWDYCKPLKRSNIPAPLIVVLLGISLKALFQNGGASWDIGISHLVQVPVAESWSALSGFIRPPEFASWTRPEIYQAGVTVAIVASLETLLNLEAVDKLDPRQRTSPASRELLAQGVGNVICGLTGGLPVTSVIVRSSVNINSGGQTKLATIVHGLLLLVCVAFLPVYLNMIPLSCLAAILFTTGLKLASPSLFKKMWREGRYQFGPFLVTLVAIVLTDLLVGILIGLGVSVAFILAHNMHRPIRRILEKHVGGDVLHIELANQVSFLNRASLEHALAEVPRGGHVLLDARQTSYIDPDILSLIRDFKEQTGPARGVSVSLRGFQEHYHWHDEIQFVDYSTRELQDRLTPAQVLDILREGNERFRTGRRLTRDFERQLHSSALGQHPLAVILSCIDSRIPSELILDLGLGDIFSVRIAGNVTSPRILGSLEYGCAVAGAKLIVVLGHTHCGAVTAAAEAIRTRQNMADTTGCRNLEPILTDIHEVFDQTLRQELLHSSEARRREIIDQVAKENVRHSMRQILAHSDKLRELVAGQQVGLVGGMYDVVTGRVDFSEIDYGSPALN